MSDPRYIRPAPGAPLVAECKGCSDCTPGACIDDSGCCHETPCHDAPELAPALTPALTARRLRIAAEDLERRALELRMMAGTIERPAAEPVPAPRYRIEFRSIASGSGRTTWVPSVEYPHTYGTYEAEQICSEEPGIYRMVPVPTPTVYRIEVRNPRGGAWIRSIAWPGAYTLAEARARLNSATGRACPYRMVPDRKAPSYRIEFHHIPGGWHPSIQYTGTYSAHDAASTINGRTNYRAVRTAP